MASWLRLISDSGGWCLEDSGKFWQTVHSMERPAYQFPSLILMVGSLAKRQALRCLLPHNNTTKQGVLGITNVHIQNSNTDTLYPNIFVDGRLETSISRCQTVPGRSDGSLGWQYRIRQKETQSYEYTRDQIFYQCIIPFVHVLCIFVDEFEDCERWLNNWLSVIRDNELATNPQIIFVLTEPGKTLTVEDAMKSPLREMDRLKLPWAVVNLRDRTSLSPVARYEPLRSRIQGELGLAREDSQRRRLLFSAIHLENLMRKAVEHVAEGLTTKFDLITAARDHNPMPSGVQYHLGNFLSIARQHGMSITLIGKAVASALIVDSYPPQMHKFNPKILFQRLYADHCEAACRAVELHSGCRAIEKWFVLLFHRIEKYPRPVALRRHVLRSQSRIWVNLQSNLTCLFCLLRGTSEALPCGHAICAICIRRLADSKKGECYFYLDSCHLCQESLQYTVKQLPPTQGPNLLVLDGGGIRGMVILGYLKALAERLHHESLREDFDLTVGTSVGGLIALYQVVKNYSPRRALEIFAPLARDIFPYKQHRGAIGLCARLVRNLLADGSYDSDVLDITLKEALGNNERLYAAASTLSAESRVAVTASQVDHNGSLCVFTNYRTPERHNTFASYELIAPVKTEDEPLVWQVARCAVAALGYFRTMHLDTLGTFQDGGVCANCPVKVALRESSLLWPTAQRPNLLVSVGTGYQSDKGEDTFINHHLPQGVANIFSQGYIKRAKDAFLNSVAVDAGQGWKDACDSIPDHLKSDVFRLDLPFSSLPELDEANRIDELASLEYHIPDRLIHVLLATSFFFELDVEPSPSKQVYRCQGSILCSKRNPNAVLDMVKDEMPDAVFMLNSGENLGKVEVHDGCESCGYYKKTVDFNVGCLEDNIGIEMTSALTSCKIGGFPASVQGIMNNMAVGAAFGRPDHGVEVWPPVRHCYCAVGVKRRRSGLTEENKAKKRRGAAKASANMD